MSDEEILIGANNKIKAIENLTDEDIVEEAFEQIKGMKKELPLMIFKHNNKKSKKAIFLAGSPGAGKTEVAEMLVKKLQIDSIGADEIRKFCKHYNGGNAHLFQKASSRGVSILLDYAFKNNVSFILDGNFTQYSIQKNNIDRALKNGYDVEINYIYRPFADAKKYTETRELKVGRKINDEVFKLKSISAVETVSRFYDYKPEQVDKFYEYTHLPINFYDLSKNKAMKCVSKDYFLNSVEKDLEELKSGATSKKEFLQLKKENDDNTTEEHNDDETQSKIRRKNRS